MMPGIFPCKNLPPMNKEMMGMFRETISTLKPVMGMMMEIPVMIREMFSFQIFPMMLLIKIISSIQLQINKATN